MCRIYRVVFTLLFITARFCHASSEHHNESSDEDLVKPVPEAERIPLPNPDCPQEDDPCQYNLETLEAIKLLHKQIDDDASGNIDVSESQEFFRDELQNHDPERQSLFHGKDDKISVEDLWHSWKKSSVNNWTVDDVLEWLVNSVELPQYALHFKDRNVNGTALPRVAVNSHHFISKDLGIKNPVHKHKLSLKAMDVVLFGPTHRSHHIMKDIALVTSIVVALGGCWFAYRQNKSSKSQISKMMKDLDSLQKAEDSLFALNTKLQKAEATQVEALNEKKEIEQKYRSEIDTAKAEAERIKNERQDSNLEEMSRLQLAEEELIQVRAALVQAEEELESRGFWGAPPELQQWLQYTFEVEQQHFQAKQQAAQRQFGSARDACDKIRKKRTGVLGTLRIAQDNSIDDIDKRIVQARMALEEIRRDLQERQQRWQTIESYCNFPIRTNPGLAKLEYALYGDGGSITSSASSARLTSMVAPLNVEDADEDFPPQYQAATAMLFATKPNGCTRTPSSSDYSLDSVKSATLPANFTTVKGSWKGLGSALELKRRQVHTGSTNSLCKSPSQVLPSPTDPAQAAAQLAPKAGPSSLDSALHTKGVGGSGGGVATGSLDGATGSLHPKAGTPSSNGSHSTTSVSFHLGNHSPASSPESPATENIFPLESTSSEHLSQRIPRHTTNATATAAAGGSGLQNGSRIPKRDTVAQKSSSLLLNASASIGQRSVSESNFQKKVLQKQIATVGGVVGGCSSQDEDSLSGTESLDSEGRRKDKKKHKLLPKFMRKGD